MSEEFKDVSLTEIVQMDTLAFSRYMRHLDRALGLEDQTAVDNICAQISKDVWLQRNNFSKPSLFEILREAVDLSSNYANIHHSFKWGRATVTTAMGISIEQNIIRALTAGESLKVNGKLDAVSFKIEIPFSTK